MGERLPLDAVGGGGAGEAGWVGAHAVVTPGS